jgi:biotin carboxyl carrier protein
MDKPSLIAVSIRRDRQIDSHPGTLNFKARLDEAQRINQMNVIIASRLETVKPCYIKKEVTTTFPMRTKIKIDSNIEHSPHLRVLNIGELVNLNTNQGHLNHKAVGTPFSSVDRLNRNSILTNKAMNTKKQIKLPKQKPRVPKILLEYIKIQRGQTIDTVVMKEPFKDRFAVFGIDVTSGQRFELHFSSEEVFNVLEGDMLVTSVENKAVWTALLEKVELQPVQKFTKFLPSLTVHEIQENPQYTTIFPAENQDTFDGDTEEILLDGHNELIMYNEGQEMTFDGRVNQLPAERNFTSDDVLMDQERYNTNDLEGSSHTEVLCIHSQSSDHLNEDQLKDKNQQPQQQPQQQQLPKQQQQQQQQQQQTSHPQPQHNDKERKRQSVPSYMRSRKSAVEDDIKPEPSNGLIPPGQRVRQGIALYT